MSIPNRFDIVQQVHLANPHLIQENTRKTITEFLWRVVAKLAQADPRFGFLSKSPGENGTEIPGVGRVALDALCYQGEHPSVDIVVAAGDGPGSGGIGWSEDPHRRTSNLWVQAVPFPGTPQPPPPDPPAPGDIAEITKRIRELEAEIKALDDKISGAALDSAEAMVLAKQALDRVTGLRTKGTINVPVVLEGGFRARAKGDVDLAVGE